MSALDLLLAQHGLTNHAAAIESLLRPSVTLKAVPPVVKEPPAPQLPPPPAPPASLLSKLAFWRQPPAPPAPLLAAPPPAKPPSPPAPPTGSNTSAVRGSVAPTQSRLGGLPHLPAGMQWPFWGKKPLSFLATINLAEVAPYDKERVLPRSGLLYFWYVDDQSAWGFDPADAGFCRVDYVEDVTQPLTPTQAPPKLKPFKLRGVQFGHRYTFPDPDWINEFAPQHKAIAQHEGYQRLTETIIASGHRMLGYAAHIHCPMELECQLVTNGVYYGNPSWSKDPRAKALEPGARDWRLLLQLDTDDGKDGPGWMWGDAGRIYFWIPSVALANRRFERSWMCLQCY